MLDVGVLKSCLEFAEFDFKQRHVSFLLSKKHEAAQAVEGGGGVCGKTPEVSLSRSSLAHGSSEAGMAHLC